MRWASRTDGNHSDIVQALTVAGWTVEDCSRFGGGFPDLLCARMGELRLVEVKDGAKCASARKLTKDEEAFHARMARAGVKVAIVTTIEEAVRL